MAVEKKNKKQDENISAKSDLVFDDSHTEEATPVEETTEVEVNDVTEEEGTMPISAVEGLLKKMEERLSNQFNAKLQKIKSLGRAKQEIDEGEDYISDLEDDWLDIPVVFFAYSFNFGIYGDKKMGKETEPPQGAVRFQPVIRQKRQGRRGDEVISVSSVKVHSKAVVEYLRNHSMFGISFFENMDDVINMNTDWAQRLIEANNEIKRLSDQQVIARCRQEGVPIGQDISVMRKMLVDNSAKRSIKHQEQVLYSKLQNTPREKGTDRMIEEKTIPQ